MEAVQDVASKAKRAMAAARCQSSLLTSLEVATLRDEIVEARLKPASHWVVSSLWQTSLNLKRVFQSTAIDGRKLRKP